MIHTPTRRRTRLALAATLAAIPLAVTGCARHSNGTIDAPLARQDNTPAQIINQPNGWRNVATKCIPFQPGKRIYETRGQYTVPVIVDDPNCKASR